MGRIRRAVAKQTVQQKHIQKTHGLGGDTDGLKRVQVHQPHFHVLHAPLAQRMQRPLAGVDRALGADRAVELVLDLQQAGAQLAVAAILRTNADGLVAWIGNGERRLD